VAKNGLGTRLHLHCCRYIAHVLLIYSSFVYCITSRYILQAAVLCVVVFCFLCRKSEESSPIINLCYYAHKKCLALAGTCTACERNAKRGNQVMWVVGGVVTGLACYVIAIVSK